MKVFISHAGGGKSLEAARLLRDWLPSVIQALDPWMSKADIVPGARWATDLQEELRDSRYGILCITKVNPNAPWLLFEAGSLAKTLEETYVVPLLIDVDPGDLPSALSQFQGVPADKEGLKSIVVGINGLLERPLAGELLTRQFELLWPNVDERLRALPEDEPEVAADANVFPGKIFVSVGSSMLEDARDGIQWDNHACFLVRERDDMREPVELVAAPVGGGYEVEMGRALRAAIKPDKSYELHLADTDGRSWHVSSFYPYQRGVKAKPVDPVEPNPNGAGGGDD